MDPEVLKMVEGLLEKNKYGPGRESSSGNPFKNYLNWVETVGERMLQVGTEFTLTQGFLKSLNPISPKIYNPATPFLPLPLQGGFITDSLDVPLTSIEGISRDKRDIHKQNYEGRFVDIKTGGPLSSAETRIKTIFPGGKTHEQLQNELNIYPNSQNGSPNQMIMIDTEDLGLGRNQRGVKFESPFGAAIPVPDWESIFDKKQHGPGFLEGDAGGTYFQPKPGAIFQKSRTRIARESAIANPDSYFSIQDYQKGYVQEDDFTQSAVGEDGQYVPFFIVDLRKPDRRLYFRAFLTSFRESIAPEWTQEKFYGRIDPVAIYKSTSRTFSVSFKMASFSPVGFSTMWKKINNLSKMVYPTFHNGVMTKSPVLRMRIGDVMADGRGQGLPGYISSPIELDYSNVPWEITSRPDQVADDVVQVGRAPMMLDASFTFQVIHEDNPEIDNNYNFDSYNFRNIGLNNEIVSGPGEENPSPEVEGSTFSEAEVSELDPGGVANAGRGLGTP